MIETNNVTSRRRREITILIASRINKHAPASHVGAQEAPFFVRTPSRLDPGRMPDERVRRPVHPLIDIEKIQPSPRILRMRRGSILGCPRQQNLRCDALTDRCRGRNTSIFPHAPFSHPPLLRRARRQELRGRARCYRPPLWPVGPCDSVAGKEPRRPVNAPSRTCDANSSRSSGMFQSTTAKTAGRGDPLAPTFRASSPTREAIDIVSVLTRRVPLSR